MPSEVHSITTGDGRVIRREEFPRVTVPEDVSTHYTAINKGGDTKSARELSLLREDCMALQKSLDTRFDRPTNGEKRVVGLDPSGEYVAVQNFPLPDQYQPDYLDILLVTTHYPNFPPVGIHLLKRNNENTVTQLHRYFQHTYEDTPISKAEEIPGYIWVCYHYDNHRWRYNANNIAQGDNMTKFLDNFFTALEAAA
jgi:hypothetical protein